MQRQTKTKQFTQALVNPALVAACTLGLCLFNGIQIASAQIPPNPAVPAVAPPAPPVSGSDADDPIPYVSDKDYKLSPDDSIDIQVVDHPEANVSVVVMPNGTIKYPHIGQKKVSGMTAAKLEEIVTKALNGGGDPKKAYYINPQVLIYVRTHQLRTVNVVGTGIKTTGKTAIKEGWHLFDLIASLGGVSSDRLEFYDAQLIRSDGTTRKINLPALYLQDVSENVRLRPDDIILINALDESKTTMQVIGEVAKPGSVLVPRDGSLALVLAQVQPSPRAHLTSAKIERNGETIPVDLGRWFKDGQVDSEVKVQPGDRLVIPENKRTYSIYGPIGKSGTQIYPDDRKLTILSVLADAGGNTEGLELQDVRVIRPAQQEGAAPKIIKVDVKNMLSKGDLSKDVPILPGDLVYFSAAKRRRGLSPQEILGFVGAIPILGYFFRR